ncbi:MAG: hypothetical protein HUJ68_01630 [Clostridia bacterium]|nr:hypothetical protein [Clostridia bacterium]
MPNRGNYFFNEYQWEAIQTVILIINFVNALEYDENAKKTKAYHDDIDIKIERMEKKLDLILEKLSIQEK